MRTVMKRHLYKEKETDVNLKVNT